MTLAVKVALNPNTINQPYPNDKILDWTKLKAFADDKLKTASMMISLYDRAENIVREGEMLVNSIFSFSYNVF